MLKPVARERRRKLKTNLLLAAVVIGSGVCPVAQAEEAATASQDADEVSNDETVVVTARRRDEQLKDVPAAVSSVGANELKWRNVVAVNDITSQIPNVRVSNSARGGSDAVFTIRGRAPADVTPVFDPSVGIYFDGVYVARTQGALTNLFDIESVQILRGAQGTLFGRNSLGGALLIASKKPTQELEGKVSVGYANHERRTGSLLLNLPLVQDKLAIRGSIQSRISDGYAKNLFTGNNNLGGNNEQNYRLALLAEPTEGLSLLLQYDGTRSNDRPRLIQGSGPGALTLYGLAESLGIISDADALPRPEELGHFETLGGQPNSLYKQVLDGYTGTLNYDYEGWNFNAILAYRDLDIQYRQDQDGTPAPVVDADMPNYSKQTSLEVKIGRSFMDDRLDLLSGFGLFYEDAGNQVNQNTEWPLRRSYAKSDVENDSIAFFAHGIFQATPDLSLGAGVRYTEDTRRIESSGYRLERTIDRCIVVPSLRIAPDQCLAEAKAKFDYVSWEATATYSVSDAWNVYAKVAKGYKSGGFNASVQNGLLNPFKPESTLDYELGVKGSSLDGDLSLNATVFYSDLQDMQRLVIRTFTGAQSVYAFNADSGSVAGAELEVVYRPVENLVLRGSFGYTDAKYDNFEFTDPLTQVTTDYSHNIYALVPEFTYSLSARYTVPLEGSGEIAFQVDWSYQDDVQFAVENDPNMVQQGYGLLNARVAYISEDGAWELAAYGQNLTDKEYYLNGSVYNVPAKLYSKWVGEPIFFGVDLTYHWGGS